MLPVVLLFVGNGVLFAASFCGRGSVAAGAVVGVSRLGRVHPDHAFASVHGHAVQERIAEACQN